MKILEGIRVIEIGAAIAGPFCGQVLGDHGAEVIKVEAIGDPGHKRTPTYKGISLYHMSMNRNKKSIALDLKSEEGRDVLYKLIKDSDVLLTNYTADVPEKLGFDYETISKINPQIIMTHITGFGLSGRYRDKRAYDTIVLGMGGVLDLIGEPDGPPMMVGVYMADHYTSIQAAFATLLAIHDRDKTGKGKLIDISMLDNVISTHAFNFADTILNNATHTRTGSRVAFTFSGIFPTKDSYVMVAPLTERMWNGFCDVIEKEEWRTENSEYLDMNKRLEDFDKLEAGFVEWAKDYTSAEVLEKLDNAGIPCGPIYTIRDVINDPNTKERNMIIPLNIEGYEDAVAAGQPIKFIGDSYSPVSPPPFLGEHSEEILSEIGYSEDEINTLTENGVIEKYNN